MTSWSRVLRSRLGAGAAGLLLAATASAVQVKIPFVHLGRSGALTYTADAQGNHVPDFSAAGYREGGVPLPTLPVRVRVTPVPGDNGPRIQAAIDYVSHLPLNAHGHRGAVLLAPGHYDIAGHLSINANGVVLRGSGSGENGTVLVATGQRRRTLIQVAGTGSYQRHGPILAVAEPYVPVGATQLALDSTEGLHVGERVLVERPSTKAWIAAIGMNVSPGREPFAWEPGKMNLHWERTITAINGPRITLDAPLTTALERRFGGGTVTAVSWPGRLSEVGVENLRCESVFNPANPKDEDHSWMAVSVDAAENAWVANVTAVHFCSSAVQLGSGTRAVTVEDCACLAPVSEIGGYRRWSFHTSGELTLFLRCRAEHGIHDFTVGYLATGPNVFLNCRDTETLGWSGSSGSWASGILFDNVHLDGSSLDLDNLETWNQGVGWAAANSVLWQCSAARMYIRRPPTAQNWAIGVWAEFLGDGAWDQVNEFVRPESLYRQQLADRLGASAVAALDPRPAPAVTADAPTLEQAVPNLAALIAPKPRPAGKPLVLARGWLTANGGILAGKPAPELEWWRGMVLPTRAKEFGAAITRFVPGRTGRGYTDNLGHLTDNMVKNNEVVVRHHYGLWYDRRRMDHERVRRQTPGDWPPFFEQPFARSGQGQAWDRMSKYDLTKYNPWYFRRLHDFAELCRQKGLVLINEMYFQHNILEAGAHWVDCPWRPANCIQPTGFPEPPPFTDSEGHVPPNPDLGKRIFMAVHFYNPNNPLRRPLHEAFIRHCLANLADEPNVIHTLTAENSGPLPFMQFWLDVIAKWERQTGHHPLIALSAPKDVQDAILADPKRAAIVDVIDLTYWWRLDNGMLFAPPGGTTQTPRQYERKWRHGLPSATALAAMAHEYRVRFPNKAIITGLEQRDGWPFVAAGGSLPELPATTAPALRHAIAGMQPVAVSSPRTRHIWALGAPGQGYFLCSVGAAANQDITLPGASGSFVVQTINPATGTVAWSRNLFIQAGQSFSLPAAGQTGVWWLVPQAK